VSVQIYKCGQKWNVEGNMFSSTALG